MGWGKAPLDIRKKLAREALAAWTAWQVEGTRDGVGELVGKLAGSLDLLLEAVEEAGL